MAFVISKKRTGITVSFIDSPSAEDVTGSMVLIKTPNHNILLDAGMHQTNDRFEDFKVNNRRLKEIKPKCVDTIIISHDHADHICLLPKLFKDGCNANVYVVKGSASIMQKMLLDSARINERDILVINSQNNKDYSPLYTEEDVFRAMDNVFETPISTEICLDDEISFTFIPSGHLLFGSQILLAINDNGIKKTILYTGDIGNKKITNKYVGKYEQAVSADVVIAESTYGDRPDLKTGKKERENDLQKIKSIIDTQIKDLKGKVICPCFAQSRTPQIATMVYEIYRDSEWKPQVYIDSPLAVELMKDYLDKLEGKEKKLFDEMMECGFIRLITEPTDSMAIVENEYPGFIISSSGMCNVGRIKHYLKKNIPNPNATILFCGYSSEGSLASLLKDVRNKSVTIDMKEYTCRCNVYSLKSLSGHAPFDQLVDNYTKINTNKIVLHHGSSSAKETLKQVLEKEFAKKCKTTRVVIANSSLKFSL